MLDCSTVASKSYTATLDGLITTLLGLIVFPCKDWRQRSARIWLREIWKHPEALVFD